jgi:hypothetical protein
MTKLPPPEQWALCKMDEMEIAEMIEEHIDFYVEDEDGNRRSVHYPMPFVRHYVRRHDGALPTIVAYATMPLVMGDGTLLAPPGLDRKRGIQFIIPDEVRAIVPKRADCTPERVRSAIKFLFDEWLVDVATDGTGKALLVAIALSIMERSLLDNRPCFFVTAGRRGNGKTTAIQMLIIAVIGDPPAASAWSSNEEERRKALMSHFIYGMPYILWDNIAKGLQIACQHIEKACTSKYYADRKLGVTELIRTAASLIHIFTGNNIGPKGDLASRSLIIRLNADRADPENRPFRHQFPLDWTMDHRAEILAGLYTILLGNPQLDAPRNAKGKTRFRMWWRLVGSALEHAVGLIGHELDFGKLFIEQEGDDEESASLADVLEIMLKKWPGGFEAQEAAEVINDLKQRDEDAQTLRDFLLPGVLADRVFSAKTVTRALKKHRDGPVRSDKGRTLVLRSEVDTHLNRLVYKVKILPTT